ncbi:hypothetical protein EDD11_003158 [Mortierella claussenii]|nr:hypothetical protein EDD11_003158 [Mortierella claussenii]
MGDTSNGRRDTWRQDIDRKSSIVNRLQLPQLERRQLETEAIDPTRYPCLACSDTGDPVQHQYKQRDKQAQGCELDPSDMLSRHDIPDKILEEMASHQIV